MTHTDYLKPFVDEMIAIKKENARLREENEELKRSFSLMIEASKQQGLTAATRYTAPPQREWQMLTNDEINTVVYNNHPLDGFRTFARTIEAKLKEKNT